LRIRRRHVEAAMQRAGIPSPRRAAAAMYRALGTSAFEFLWLAARRRVDLHARILPDSRPIWDAALARGRGVVVAASHTGNWDLAACAMAREVELLVVTKRLRARGLDAFWQTTRAAQGVTLVEARGALARAREVLARKGAVALMIDQVPDRSRHAVQVEFLGATAFVDRAPAVLAAQTGAPLVVAAARRSSRGEGGVCVMEVLDVLEPPARAGRTWIDDATRRATAALERFVRAYPSEWLWLHRRWRPPFSQ
jgi:KDO2-lipid IV(A) lauroyltransferase